MIKRGQVLLILLIFTLIMTSVAFGRDFFLFDLEKNKILHMGPNEMTFSEKIDMEKMPDMILPTNDPDKFLVLFLPEQADQEVKRDKNGRELKPADEGKAQAGQLRLINIADGKTEDMIDLGYAPFSKALSKDHKQFAIAYRVAPGLDTFEMVYYNIPEKKSAKTSKVGSYVYDLAFSADCASLYVLTDQLGGKMLTINPASLKTEKIIEAGSDPYQIYVLGNDRVALLDLGIKDSQAGTVRLVDTVKNEIVERVDFEPADVYYRWYEKEGVLLVITRNYKAVIKGTDVNFTYEGTGKIIRADAGGLKNFDTTMWWDFDYSTEKDIIYVVNNKEMQFYDFKSGKTSKIKTGENTWVDFATGYTRFYSVKALPDANLAAVYTLWLGHIKFYDLSTGKLVKNLKGGSINAKYLEDWIDDKTVVTTNADHTRYYTFMRGSKGIAVYNEKFDKIASFPLDEPQVGMYQIKKPTVETLFVTEKHMYKIQNDKLVMVCEFKNKLKEVLLYDDNQRLNIFTDKEWLVLDPATFEVKSRLNFTTEPDQKYTKLKPGEQRYQWIDTIVTEG